MRAPLSIIVLVAFILTCIIGPLPQAHAGDLNLPAPGLMVHLSSTFNLPMLKGIKVYPRDPFHFDFILQKGDVRPQDLQQESIKLIKYFLAGVTIPKSDLWVNLSPYEKNRIIPSSFGMTDMGRDLLAQDYMLKQITASLIYPEDPTGQKFWKKIYEEAYKRYGRTDMAVNTFNKVWILPAKAVVCENAKTATAYVLESSLKVLTEEDYLSLEKHQNHSLKGEYQTHQLGSQIVREIIIPELTHDVNEGKNFAQLRQVYNALILAEWYKRKIKDSIISDVYADKNKITGINLRDPKIKEKIYQQYLKAFKQGVFNYIKEDQDPLTHAITPKKYFSGGSNLRLDQAMAVVKDNTSNRSKFGQIMAILGGTLLIGAFLRNCNPNSVSTKQTEPQVEVATELPTQAKPTVVKQNKHLVYRDRLPGLVDLLRTSSNLEHIQENLGVKDSQNPLDVVNNRFGLGLTQEVFDTLTNNIPKIQRNLNKYALFMGEDDVVNDDNVVTGKESAFDKTVASFEKAFPDLEPGYYLGSMDAFDSWLDFLRLIHSLNHKGEFTSFERSLHNLYETFNQKNDATIEEEKLNKKKTEEKVAQENSLLAEKSLALFKSAHLRWAQEHTGKEGQFLTMLGKLVDQQRNALPRGAGDALLNKLTRTDLKGTKVNITPLELVRIFLKVDTLPRVEQDYFMSNLNIAEGKEFRRAYILATGKDPVIRVLTGGLPLKAILEEHPVVFVYLNEWQRDEGITEFLNTSQAIYDRDHPKVAEKKSQKKVELTLEEVLVILQQKGVLVTMAEPIRNRLIALYNPVTPWVNPLTSLLTFPFATVREHMAHEFKAFVPDLEHPLTAKQIFAEILPKELNALEDFTYSKRSLNYEKIAPVFEQLQRKNLVTITPDKEDEHNIHFTYRQGLNYQTILSEAKEILNLKDFQELTKFLDQHREYIGDGFNFYYYRDRVIQEMERNLIELIGELSDQGNWETHSVDGYTSVHFIPFKTPKAKGLVAQTASIREFIQGFSFDKPEMIARLPDSVWQVFDTEEAAQPHWASPVIIGGESTEAPETPEVQTPAPTPMPEAQNTTSPLPELSPEDQEFYNQIVDVINNRVKEGNGSIDDVINHVIEETIARNPNDEELIRNVFSNRLKVDLMPKNNDQIHQGGGIDRHTRFDKAMLRNKALKGGIDFARQLPVGIQSSEGTIQFHLDRAMMSSMLKISGFEINKITITPLTNLSTFFDNN